MTKKYELPEYKLIEQMRAKLNKLCRISTDLNKVQLMLSTTDKKFIGINTVAAFNLCDDTVYVTLDDNVILEILKVKEETLFKELQEVKRECNKLFGKFI